MKEKALHLDTIFALISLLSLWYMRYYEHVLYYKPINDFLDVTYVYIAFPVFYFFIAACIATIFVNLFKINIPKGISVPLVCLSILILVLYSILVILRIMGLIVLPYIVASSLHYWILFAGLGCLFALVIKIKCNERNGG